LRRTRFDRAPCPIARTTDLIGDWWTPVLLRNACLGVRRFEDFQRTLGVPRAVLAKRLERLVAEGLLTREPYQQRPLRTEYRLTDKGRAFFDVLAAMWRWGEDWLWPDGEPPVELVDRETGRRIRPVVVDEATGERIDLRKLRAAAKRAAPGAAGKE
jgi:DNA-binding HxlR family transcriptional regulator